MEHVFSAFRLKTNTQKIVFDIIALGLIYCIPAISHLLALPVYFIEPMRLLIILSIVHTNKFNTYLLAVTLPLFSFLLSAHPSVLKSLLIISELTLNIWLFHELLNKFNNRFTVMFSSILISKLFYYIIKYGLITAALIKTELFSTPIIIQIVTMLAFSGYVYFIYLLKSKDGFLKKGN